MNKEVTVTAEVVFDYLETACGFTKPQLERLTPYVNEDFVSTRMQHIIKEGVTDREAILTYVISEFLMTEGKYYYLFRSEDSSSALVFHKGFEFIIVNIDPENKQLDDSDLKITMLSLINEVASKEVIGRTNASVDVSSYPFVSLLEKCNPDGGYLYSQQRPAIIDAGNKVLIDLGDIKREGYYRGLPRDERKLQIITKLVNNSEKFDQDRTFFPTLQTVYDESNLETSTKLLNDKVYNAIKTSIINYIEALGWRGDVTPEYWTILKDPRMFHLAYLLVSKGYTSNLLFRVCLSIAHSVQNAGDESDRQWYTFYDNFSSAYAVDKDGEYIVIGFSPKVAKLTGEGLKEKLWARIERFKKNNNDSVLDSNAKHDILLKFLNENNITTGFLNGRRPLYIIGGV